MGRAPGPVTTQLNNYSIIFKGYVLSESVACALEWLDNDSTHQTRLLFYSHDRQVF